MRDAALIKTILGRLGGMHYRSWDHYDFWGSPAGIRLRRHRNAFTLPLIGAAYFADIVFPMLFRRRAVPTPPLETMPEIMRAMAVYHWLTGDDVFEKDRERLLREMLGHMGKSAHGAGMGHPFDWYTTTLIPAHTPCVPLSWNFAAYLLEDYPDGYREQLEGTGNFIYHDCNAVEMDGGKCKVSYTPLDRRWVINANAAASRALRRLGEHCGNPLWNARAERILAYVLDMQEKDGGWYYFERGSVPDAENFIDCFHSAFVLEHLMEWAAEGHAGAARAVERGLPWFAAAFVRENGSVRPFAVSHLPVTMVADIRACAGAIGCLARASRFDSRYGRMARGILDHVLKNMYDGAGGFYFRKYRLFTSRMNYIRWGAAPMLGALAALVEGEGGK